MQTSDLNVNNTESDHANEIFRQFQDAIFSGEHTSVKTLTKIIFDLLQWQEIATLSLPKKAAIASFIWTTFRRHFRLGANDITRNRSHVIFCRACVDVFRRWTCLGTLQMVSWNYFVFSINVCYCMILKTYTLGICLPSTVSSQVKSSQLIFMIGKNTTSKRNV